LNTREEILAKFRANEPFAKIRTEVPSVSKLYEVAGQYLDELQTHFENTRVQISQDAAEKARVQAQVESLRSEVENLRKEKQELEQEKTRVSNELSEETMKLNNVEKRADEFRAQGFTQETMENLQSMVERGGAKLLKQVENVEEYHQAMKGFTGLKKSKACLLKEVRALQCDKEKAQDSVASLRNQIDELRLQMRHIKDAVDTVVWLMQKGYTMEDIKSLGYALDFLYVQGDPGQSVASLLIALRKAKNLVILEEKVTGKRQEYAELVRTVEDNKMKLKILEEAALKSINEFSNTSIQDLRQMATKGEETFTATCQKFDAHVQASLANLQVQATDRAEWVEKQCRRESELAQQKTIFETELKYGRFYQAFLVSDDFLSRISPPWILHVSHRLHLWISMKLPKETVIPPSMFWTQVGLMNWPYNLSILAELVCLGLEKVSQQSVPPNGGKVGAG
jgi:predicted nuclease with TOPRIM domain